MSDQSISLPSSRLQLSRWWLLAALAILLLVANYFEGMQRMFSDWMEGEEYSHGILLPFVSAYLIWQRREELRGLVAYGHWSGWLIIAIALLTNVMGKYASVFALQQYSLILALYGLIVCVGGWAMLRKILAPMLLLLLMVPLPNFFLNNISAQLQLISSYLGMKFIRAVGISVFLEGNVIDLGQYKLQVAEACSGLRYLFPLLTMSFIMAYLFNTSWWKRALVFISSVPLTILMNSLRIGVIGVLVEHWGTSMAEGFLHQFQGWVVFMFSTGILFLEVMVLARLSGHSWRQQFGLQPVIASHSTSPDGNSFISKSVWIGLMLMLVATPVVFAIPKQTEVIPTREFFNSFPLQLDAWQGKRQQMERVYMDGLMLDDYLLADYTAAASKYPVNFYVAWYDSQQAGHSAHSPRSCLPGGGWHINSIADATIADVAGHPLKVNRVVLQNGDQRQLVYYWFQQRGHVITNEYMVKWYLFWDSMTRHRSDGAMVRMIIPILEGESVAAADTQLANFVRAAVPKLTPFIPE